jgi:redox-sensitive bicupin YhaK (pirin superfamily)
VVDIECLDVTLPPNFKWQRDIKQGYKTFAYVINGNGLFDPGTKEPADTEHLVIFRDEGPVSIVSKKNELRFLLVSGKPLAEPVCWGGPIVMNSQAELNLAFKEFQEGTFIKHK